MSIQKQEDAEKMDKKAKEAKEKREAEVAAAKKAAEEKRQEAAKAAAAAARAKEEKAAEEAREAEEARLEAAQKKVEKAAKDAVAAAEKKAAAEKQKKVEEESAEEKEAASAMKAAAHAAASLLSKQQPKAQPDERILQPHVLPPAEKPEAGKKLRGQGKKAPATGLVYLWSAPLKSWGEEIDAAPPRMALLTADSRVQHHGIAAHQDAAATEAMVHAQFAKNLHISDGFSELEANDRHDEEEMKKEFKVYDPVAAVPTTDLKPRLRKSVELHDIFAKLEVQDAQVSDQLARFGDNADFGAVRRVEDESMRYLEQAQKPSAEITPAPLSWKDTEPEASISLHEPFLKMEKKDSAEVKETEHRQEMQLLQIH